MKKLNRRDFIRSSMLAGAGALILPSCLSTASSQNIGFQLYTLREFLAEKPKEVLNQLGEIGYKEVENFGYANGLFFGMSPQEYKQTLDNAGLKAVSGHYLTGSFTPDSQGSLMNGWKKSLDDANAIGQKYVVLAWLGPDERKTLDDYKKVVELTNKCAEEAKNAGLQFCYHNHDFEFIPVDGKVPMDLILEETDPELVQIELDLYWASKVKVDPVKLFEQNPGRFPLVHVKDMDDNGDFAPVGTGNIDFNRIFQAEEKGGIKHYFVEQDQIKGDKWAAVKTSYSNAKELI